MRLTGKKIAVFDVLAVIFVCSKVRALVGASASRHVVDLLKWGFDVTNRALEIQLERCDHGDMRSFVAHRA